MVTADQHPNLILCFDKTWKISPSSARIQTVFKSTAFWQLLPEGRRFHRPQKRMLAPKEHVWSVSEAIAFPPIWKRAWGCRLYHSLLFSLWPCLSGDILGSVFCTSCLGQHHLKVFTDPTLNNCVFFLRLQYNYASPLLFPLSNHSLNSSLLFSD